MSEEELFKLRGVRHSYVIKDPYPEHSEWERSGPINRLFGEMPPEISIHKAWADGAKFAFDLMEEKAKSMVD